MSLIQIMLPESIKKFIDQQVAEGKYASCNDYILALIHQERAKDIPITVEKEELDQSANLYAEVYEQDRELKELTEIAGADLVE